VGFISFLNRLFVHVKLVIPPVRIPTMPSIALIFAAAAASYLGKAAAGTPAAETTFNVTAALPFDFKMASLPTTSEATAIDAELAWSDFHPMRLEADEPAEPRNVLPDEQPPPGGWLGFVYAGAEAGARFTLQGFDTARRFFTDPNFNFGKEKATYLEQGSSTMSTFGKLLGGIFPSNIFGVEMPFGIGQDNTTSSDEIPLSITSAAPARARTGSFASQGLSPLPLLPSLCVAAAAFALGATLGARHRHAHTSAASSTAAKALV